MTSESKIPMLNHARLGAPLGAVLCVAGALLVAAAPKLMAQQSDVPPEVLAFADMVLYNGKILTANADFTIADAVAVRDGKILAVGDSAGLLKMAGPRTERVDLRGNSVIPGFVDVHTPNFRGTHGPSGPIGTIPLTFPDLDAGLRQIKEVVDRAKPGAWVAVDIPINAATRQLTIKLLDGIAPNNPLLVNYALDAIVNSRALALVPPDIPGILKDGTGAPTGFLRGWAYGKVTYELIPWPNINKLVEEQRAILKKNVSLGVTSMGGRGSGIAITVLNTLRANGELPLRVRFNTDFPRLNVEAEGYFKRLGNLSGIGDEWFKLYGATVMSLDGTPDRGGLLTLKPKRAEPPRAGAYGPLGESKYEMSVDEGDDWRAKSDFSRIIMANHYGYAINDIHARGDKAVEIALEAFELADKERPIKGRAFGMSHGDMRTTDQIKRLAALDAVMTEAPKYLFLETRVPETYKTTYGADAIHGMFPVRTMIDSGMKPVIEANVPMRLEADGTVSTLTPGFTYISLLEKFVTRDNEEMKVTWGADQKISRQEALWMATSWASRMYGDDKILGTIEPGKLADLVILGGDYMAVPVDQISKLPVLRTIVGGRTMYQQ